MSSSDIAQFVQAEVQGTEPGREVLEGNVKFHIISKDCLIKSITD